MEPVEYDAKCITLNQRSSMEERQGALQQIYAQVLERQPYHYERKLLADAEQDFLRGKIGVKRFLKLLGCSEVYLQSFYHTSSNLKFLDWCFKHFMGRAPKNQDEVRSYCDLLMKDGVEKLITVLLDSEEYRKAFGNFTVPHPHTQVYYSSPRAFWESTVLNQEHYGQRGWVVPTMYWHELGLNCNAGVCRHPEMEEHLPASGTAAGDLLQEELLEFLKALGPVQARQIMASMSPEQKVALYKAIH